MVFTATICLPYEVVKSHVVSFYTLQRHLAPTSLSVDDLKNIVADPFAYITRDILETLTPRRLHVRDFFVQHLGDRVVFVQVAIDDSYFRLEVECAISHWMAKDDGTHPESLINVVEKRLLRLLGAVDLNHAAFDHIQERCYEVAGSLHE